MNRPNRYPYTRGQWIFKELKSNNGKIVFDGRTFEFKTGHSEALNISSEPMNVRKLRRNNE